MPGTQAAERTQANLCDAYSVIQSVANRYGLIDVVGQAVDRHITAANLSGDPLRPAVAAYRRVTHQLRWGHFDTAQRSLTRARDGITDIPNAVTYVSVLDGRVVGYYAIAVANVTSESAPVAVAKGAPRQVPCLLLARSAVDQGMQGFGLGRGLLVDALRRTVGLADSVGIRALLVHARDDAARQFYLTQAEFLESPSDPLHLLLPMNDIVRSLR